MKHFSVTCDLINVNVFFIVKVVVVLGMTEKETDLMKIETFATEAGVSVSTIYNGVKKGKIKYVKKRRGLSFMKLIPRTELSKFK